VGDTTETNELFHILYDGFVTDRQGWVAMGGQADALGTILAEKYPEYPNVPDLGTALKLGDEALRTVEGREMPPENLEVGVLDRTRTRRKFRRLGNEELKKLL
jgi:proteasome alpha subunit